MRESRCETVRAEDLMESETAGMGWRQPAFDEVIDVSDEMRERRRNRRSMRMMYAIGALLIVAAICIGGFPAALQYRAAVELSRTSAQSARTIAGWPYPQADDAFAAAKSYNERLAASGQPILGEAKDPFAAVQGGSRANETDDDDGSASSNLPRHVAVGAGLRRRASVRQQPAGRWQEHACRDHRASRIGERHHVHAARRDARWRLLLS